MKNKIKRKIKIISIIIFMLVIMFIFPNIAFGDRGVPNNSDNWSLIQLARGYNYDDITKYSYSQFKRQNSDQWYIWASGVGKYYWKYWRLNCLHPSSMTESGGRYEIMCIIDINPSRR